MICGFVICDRARHVSQFRAASIVIAASCSRSKALSSSTPVAHWLLRSLLLDLTLSLSITIFMSLTLTLSRSLALSLSRALALSLPRALAPSRSRSLALSLALSISPAISLSISVHLAGFGTGARCAVALALALVWGPAFALGFALAHRVACLALPAPALLPSTPIDILGRDWLRTAHTAGPRPRPREAVLEVAPSPVDAAAAAAGPQSCTTPPRRRQAIGEGHEQSNHIGSVNTSILHILGFCAFVVLGSARELGTRGKADTARTQSWLAVAPPLPLRPRLLPCLCHPFSRARMPPPLLPPCLPPSVAHTHTLTLSRRPTTQRIYYASPPPPLCRNHFALGRIASTSYPPRSCREYTWKADLTRAVQVRRTHRARQHLSGQAMPERVYKRGN